MRVVSKCCLSECDTSVLSKLCMERMCYNGSAHFIGLNVASVLPYYSRLGVLYQYWDRVSRFYRSVSIEIVECADEGYTVPISWVWPERECYALIRDESS